MTILLFTTNQHKKQEFQTLFNQYMPAVSIITPNELGLTMPEVEEDGSSFAENAYLKALAMAYTTPFPVLADDSGLSVHALDNNPGIKSARYAGENASDAQNRQLLCDNLKKLNLQQSTAHFTAALAFIDTQRAFIVEAECYGKITINEQGTNGFGYDPLFIPDGYDITFAQCDATTKNTISHRAKALLTLIETLRSYDYFQS
jgi:XTP/dITP diphosphohydrolase